MKIYDKNLKFKDIEYYSYGIDIEDENGEMYWYLQTASNGCEDYEIICSKYRLIPLVIGRIICFIARKKLVKW